MNWLIIFSEENNSSVKEIQTFLNQKLSASPELLNVSGLYKKDSLEDEMRAVLNASHTVILADENFFCNPSSLYLYGLASGKASPVFVVSAQEPACIAPSVSVFKDSSSLVKKLDSSFDDFVAEEERHTALSSLFAAGIPFTTDCFATYIAKDDDEKCTQFYNAGMLVDSRDSLGVPMLCIATRNDCFEKVKWLLKKGADINAVAADRGYTAVMDAVWRKNEEVTKYLIDAGADLNIISTDGQSILVLAVGNGNTKIIDMLLAAGADPDIKDSMGMSAKGYAQLFNKEPILEVFRRYEK